MRRHSISQPNVRSTTEWACFDKTDREKGVLRWGVSSNPVCLNKALVSMALQGDRNMNVPPRLRLTEPLFERLTQ